MSSPISGSSFVFDNVYIQSVATTAGIVEYQGPLGHYFDKHYPDHYHHNVSYEQAEIEMLKDALLICLKNGKVKKEEIDFYFGGDLNNQLTACYYYANHLHRPFIGLYSACSTIGLALANASIMIENHNIHKAIACTVSHNATAERQFRYPLEYGIQRKETMTFTATGSVAVYLSNKPSSIRIESITLGKVIDYDQYDANDMGRAMAPAALDTYLQHMKDLKRDGTYYDLILTGDLSHYGKTIMKDLLKEENQKYNEYDDCGCLLYDVTQNVYQGGSGPVCNALVSFGYIYKMMLQGKYKRVLVLATGVLLNPVMTNQKLSIPCVCHGYVLEAVV